SQGFWLVLGRRGALAARLAIVASPARSAPGSTDCGLPSAPASKRNVIVGLLVIVVVKFDFGLAKRKLTVAAGFAVDQFQQVVDGGNADAAFPRGVVEVLGVNSCAARGVQRKAGGSDQPAIGAAEKYVAVED